VKKDLITTHFAHLHSTYPRSFPRDTEASTSGIKRSLLAVLFQKKLILSQDRLTQWHLISP